MNSRFVAALPWTLWCFLVAGLLYGLVRAFTDRTVSPEAGRGLGTMVIIALLVVAVIMGVLLHLAVKRQSTAGVVLITVILAWPVFVLVARPAVLAFKARGASNEAARIGDFADARLASMAGAIAASDTAALRQMLGNQTPPGGVDRAGNDLLAYALIEFRDRRGSAAPIRMLLDAGARPGETTLGSGQDVLNFMALGLTDDGVEVMRLLLEHGADPNIRDPISERTPLATVSQRPEVVRMLVEHGAEMNTIQYGGVSAVVEFISRQDWASALYLIEKGADLDIKNPDGLSVDYYLESWKESVHGDHPEGWDRVRQAVAKRRESRKE